MKEHTRGPGPAVRSVNAARRGGDGAGRPMSVLMLVWGWGVCRLPTHGMPVA